MTHTHTHKPIREPGFKTFLEDPKGWCRSHRGDTMLQREDLAEKALLLNLCKWDGPIPLDEMVPQVA